MHLFDTFLLQATRGSVHQVSDGNNVERKKLRVRGIKQDCVSTLSCYDENFAEGFLDLPHHAAEIYSPTMQPRDLAFMQTMIREQWASTTHVARAESFGPKSSITIEE